VPLSLAAAYGAALDGARADVQAEWRGIRRRAAVSRAARCGLATPSSLKPSWETGDGG